MKLLITFINGLSLGGIYAMVALGYTMVYGIAKMLNFAHGDIIMVGAYAIVVFLAANMHPVLALAIAMLICMILGITIEKVAYKPIRGSSPLAVLITAIGVSYLLQSLAQIIFGSGETHAQLPTMGTLTIGAISIKHATLLTLACSLVVMVALFLFVKFSKTGRAMVAVSEDKGAAQLMGININFIITITFAIGSALAAFAGLFKLMNSEPVTPVFGSLPGIIAFTAAVVGGIGSIPGAMVGGLLLGVIECFCLSVPALATYTNAIQFAILIVILLVKPTGLLGKKRREKV
ncbi:MAG: branched-chain amino acid ABC transporter permease [Clostridia bacterium]|nr:branched-chain amino acid ABC transporter permease [Oscillospiraceae bacterium]MBQ2750433.1 branched-chain amino acid ABC transporter permease [Clostridia bacterium]MBQ4624840.1 branched-chain amino acid ABC transporter permease [Clostridia bacterium]MBQ6990202.1 branched-chain amino acid ABC transporter permease [Clostridia bacterium]MBR6762869.1 branched-chain amino acid ABC transporter permease [Clostridia bacterium]